MIAVLKANAYGHGAVELAKQCRAEKVAMIATALLEESLELRNAGIDLPLLLLGPLTESQISIALDHRITLGVVGPEELESAGGNVRVAADPKRSLTWKQACAKLGTQPIEVTDPNMRATQPPRREPLNSSGVGGAMMADVSVDSETGIVKINKMVCVQDCGLIISMKTAESQCYGAMIMGIATTLYEEKIMDPVTGRMLNPNLDFYRLAGIGDIGELLVRMMTGKGYDERGPIGLGEPPTVSPAAAISNAVANAIGVRVPFLPLTPDRVVAALNPQGGRNASV